MAGACSAIDRITYEVGSYDEAWTSGAGEPRDELPGVAVRRHAGDQPLFPLFCSETSRLPPPGALAKIVNKNAARVAEVWMDEWRDFILRRTRAKNVEIGDLTPRIYVTTSSANLSAGIWRQFILSHRCRWITSSMAKIRNDAAQLSGHDRQKVGGGGGDVLLSRPHGGNQVSPTPRGSRSCKTTTALTPPGPSSPVQAGQVSRDGRQPGLGVLTKWSRLGHVNSGGASQHRRMIQAPLYNGQLRRLRHSAVADARQVQVASLVLTRDQISAFIFNRRDQSDQESRPS